jgi:type IV pilus assembly protein PilA
MGTGKRSAQSGMTIIEVMIVVAIIGIIASVAMPNYRSYAIRAKVSEAVLALSQCRTVMHEIYLSGSSIPGIDQWGCEVERPSRYIERITITADGIVKLTLGNQIADLRVALHDITFAPLNSSGQIMGEDDLGTPVRRWRCGSPADGTDVKAEYLPGTCRGV